MYTIFTIISAIIINNLNGTIHYLLIEIERGADGAGVVEVEGGGDEAFQSSVEGNITAGHRKRKLAGVPTTPHELAYHDPHIVGEGHQEARKRALGCKGEVVCILMVDFAERHVV